MIQSSLLKFSFFLVISWFLVTERLRFRFSLPVAVVIASLVGAIASKLIAYCRLRSVDGPFSAAWSDAWHSWVILTNQSHLKYAEACQKFGHLARIGPNDLITDCPDLLMHMNAPRSGYTKTAWFYKSTRLEPGKDTCFSQTDPALHQRRRAQLAAGYSGKENKELEPRIDKHVVDLLTLLRKYAEEGRRVDLGKLSQYYSLDVISDIGFGSSFDDLVGDTDEYGYVKTLEMTLAQVAVSSATGLARLLQYDWIARKILPSGEEAEGMGRIVKIAQKVLRQRFSGAGADRSDMVSSFIRRGLTEEEIVTESLLTFVAGSDTVSSSLRSILLQLMQHPAVADQLRSETAAVHSGKGVISDLTAQRLPFLDAVIKESLRLMPPITDVIPKRVPDAGDVVNVDGRTYHLPGGTNIGYSAWSLHRRRDVFGDDAEEYRPQRWLRTESNAESLVRMNKVFDLMFGSGRHQCLGKHIGMMELRKAVVELNRAFDLLLVNPKKPWRATNYLGLWVVSDFEATVKLR